MSVDDTSDVIWVDGDDFSVQLYSAIGTRVGSVYIDGTNDDQATQPAIWTTLATVAVTAGALLSHLESVSSKNVAGIRLRWEVAAGVGTMTRATVCVQQVAKEN